MDSQGLNEIAYKRAERKVKARIGFFTHASTYVLVNLFLFLINLVTSRESWWFYWPLLGWGIGLAAHFLGVFVFGGLNIEKMIEKEMQKTSGQG